MITVLTSGEPTRPRASSWQAVATVGASAPASKKAVGGAAAIVANSAMVPPANANCVSSQAGTLVMERSLLGALSSIWSSASSSTAIICLPESAVESKYTNRLPVRALACT